jgi:hypothetical protein
MEMSGIRDESSVYANTAFLGGSDKEYFEFLGERKTATNRALGFIWDYTPSLWDKYHSIDEYFETQSRKIRDEPEYLDSVFRRARRIRDILGR